MDIDSCYISDSGIVKIVRDDSPESPREFSEPFSKIFTWIRDYHSPDKTDCDKEDFFDVHPKKDNVIFPIYYHNIGYDCDLRIDEHSSREPHGYIFLEKDIIRKNYGVKNITKQIIARVKNIFESELESYSYWMNGDVFGGIKFDFNYEEIDSCWGFYGTNYEENGIYDNFGKPIKYIKDEESLENIIENIKNINSENFLKKLEKEFEINDLEEVVEIKFNESDCFLYFKNNLIEEIFESFNDKKIDNILKDKINNIYKNLILETI